MVPEARLFVSIPPNTLDELPATRAAILRLLKTEGFSSITRIAELLGITHEAARKQVIDLMRSGWIGADCGPLEAERASAPGRPPVRYCLTAAGDHLFPKQYAALMVGVLDVIAAEGGEQALTAVLTRITDERVARLEAHVAPLSLKRRMEVLRSIYEDEDPFTEVQRRGRDFVLIERNCPYLDVALERPDLCSTTVSALRRLTGCEVVREHRFQDGDARCEFHVRAASSAPERKQPRFEKEPSRTPD